MRIRPHLRRTPLVDAPWLAPEGGGEVRLKLENRQATGSFKLRGALAKLTALAPAERAAGVVTASTGNHAAGVARAAALLGVRVEVFVPGGAHLDKVNLVEGADLTLVRVGTDCVETEAAARDHARRVGRVYVSPYNDLEVVAGQGTLGLELAREFPALDAVVVAVGGGGLASGVAAALRGTLGAVEVLGASPSASAVMAACLDAGRQVHAESLPTLSDATAGGVEEGALTVPLCRRLLAGIERVGEDAIAEAMRLVRRHLGDEVEGAAGVAVAAFRARRAALAGRRVAIVLCGGNLDPRTRRAVFAAGV